VPLAAASYRPSSITAVECGPLRRVLDHVKIRSLLLAATLWAARVENEQQELESRQSARSPYIGLAPFIAEGDCVVGYMDDVFIRQHATIEVASQIAQRSLTVSRWSVIDHSLFGYVTRKPQRWVLINGLQHSCSAYLLSCHAEFYLHWSFLLERVQGSSLSDKSSNRMVLFHRQSAEWLLDTWIAAVWSI
jgi:hypothetical protein